jgi:tetratricopeptide (TPR) repeat protein
MTRSLSLVLTGCVFAGCGQRVDIANLRTALGSSDLAVQQTACTDAAALGRKALPCVPDLVRLLESKDGTTRRLAAYAIEQIEPGTEAAIPPLKALLADTNREIAVSAANTLNRIAPDAAPIEVGDVYWKRFQEPDPALPCYRRAIQLEPKNPLGYRRVAEIQQWLGQKEDAQKNREIAERLSAERAR